MHINLQNDPCFCSPIVRSIVNPSIRMTTVCTNLGLGLGHNLSLSNLALICFLFTIKHCTIIINASLTTHPRPCDAGAVQLLQYARRCEALANALKTLLGWAGLGSGSYACFGSALVGAAALGCTGCLILSWAWLSWAWKAVPGQSTGHR